jgi:transposase
VDRNEKNITFGDRDKVTLVDVICGERLQSPAKGDGARARMLWCQKCKVWTDRDVNASVNLSTRGRSRLDRSLPSWSGTGEEEGRSQRAASSLGPVGRRKGWQVKR